MHSRRTSFIVGRLVYAFALPGYTRYFTSECKSVTAHLSINAEHNTGQAASTFHLCQYDPIRNRAHYTNFSGT